MSPHSIGSDFLKESENIALWSEENKEARLRQNILVNQPFKVAAARGQKANALAQCHTVLHRAGRWGPHF